MTKQELFNHLAAILHETFDIDTAIIKPESRLYEDLDIDSIDAVDVVVKFKALTGKRVQPEVFKSVRTVQDVVDALHTLMQS